MKRLGPVLLLTVGLLQMAGEVLHLPALKATGLATAASPAPKVFSAVRGLETYTTRFFIEWTGRDGQFHSTEITPELNSHIRGPYNRRNVYGAVLAYGPVLVSDPRSRPMFESVASYALCGDAPLLRELGVNPAEVSGTVRVRLQPRSGAQTNGLPLIVEPPCQLNP
jgi:hypothetical protein